MSCPAGHVGPASRKYPMMARRLGERSGKADRPLFTLWFTTSMLRRGRCAAGLFRGNTPHRSRSVSFFFLPPNHYS